METLGKIIPVIMSGGAGSRLWPASRQAEPKQFLPLVTDKTMLQETVARFDPDLFHPPVFICNSAHAALIEKQMFEIGRDIGAIILEPMGRNTAAVAVVAALHAQTTDEDALFLLAPADHHIEKTDAFRRNVAAAIPVAQTGHLVTFGMTPDYAATGFGYIKKGEAIRPGAFHVDKFVEKPAQALAQTYLDSGEYYWNSGIFLFNAQTLLEEMDRYAPDVLIPSAQAYKEASRKGDVISLSPDIFAKAASQPVDKAVMEKTDVAAVLPCELGWHDIGSFKALHELKSDETGVSSKGDVWIEDTRQALIETDGPVVAVVGLENVAVIVKEGRVLVLNMDKAQDVKSIVTQLKNKERDDAL